MPQQKARTLILKLEAFDFTALPKGTRPGGEDEPRATVSEQVTAAFSNLGGTVNSLVIDSQEWPYIGVHYWGTATIEGPENDADAIGRLFAKHFNGDLKAATDYGRQLMGWGKRVFVRFRPERSTTWDFRH